MVVRNIIVKVIKHLKLKDSLTQIRDVNS